MERTKYWGEIPQTHVEPISDVTADIERSMSKFCLVEFDEEKKDDAEKVDQIMYVIVAFKHLLPILLLF